MAEQQHTGAAGRRNEKVGLVVSNRMQKTIVVEVTRRVPHPLYKRVVTRRKRFYAHDEQQTAQMGDTVRIVECRPMSRLKRWVLGDVIRRAVQVAIEPSAIGLDTPAVVLPASPRRKPS
jgi:small subunit ribosomal protein S17